MIFNPVIKDPEYNV